MPTTFTIAAGGLTVEVEPDHGGRVAQITVGDTALLVGRTDVDADALNWGCYPMVPWAGRIRDGRFEFRGEHYELPRNHGAHAMHGVGFVSPWTVADHSVDRIGLTLELPADHRWPFGGSVHQRIEVTEQLVTFAMTVTARDRAFPVSFGWHPWFRKPTALDFRPTAMFRRDADHVTVDELVEPPQRPWDDCFVNELPVRLAIEGVEIELASACTHWVVYDEPVHATCVEPQTGPPDAFTIRPHPLEPGGSLTATFRLRVMSPAATDTRVTAG